MGVQKLTIVNFAEFTIGFRDKKPRPDYGHNLALDVKAKARLWPSNTADNFAKMPSVNFAGARTARKCGCRACEGPLVSVVLTISILNLAWRRSRFVGWGLQISGGCTGNLDGRAATFFRFVDAVEF